MEKIKQGNRLVIAAWAVLVVSAVVSVFMKDFSWLARSGSVAVLFCGIAEYKLMKVRMPPSGSVPVLNVEGKVYRHSRRSFTTSPITTIAGEMPCRFPKSTSLSVP